MAEPQSVVAHATSGPSGAVDADHQNLDSGVPHPYHLVSPSVWPLVGSLSGGLLAVGALLSFLIQLSPVTPTQKVTAS